MEREEPGQRETATGQNRPDANERRSGYLGFVAHEVRNPLSTALWTAELLTRMSPEERGGARGDKLSAMCLRSLSRVRQLIEDHFLCERLDVAGIPVRAESLIIGEVIDGLLRPASGRRPARHGGSRGPDRRRGGPFAARARDRRAARRRRCRQYSGAGRSPGRAWTSSSCRSRVIRRVQAPSKIPGKARPAIRRGGRSRSRSRGGSRRRWGETWPSRTVGYVLTLARAATYTPRRPSRPRNHDPPSRAGRR